MQPLLKALNAALLTGPEQKSLALLIECAMMQEFKADKQNKELQKRQSAEINKLQKLKGTLEGLKAKADVQ